MYASLKTAEFYSERSLMSLQFVCRDITTMETDAIVNAANESLLGGGGVDGAIHRAAGPKLLEECRTRGGCKTGDAVITWAYDLPSTFVIHTVGPIYQDGKHGEEALLESCYQRSLELAVSHGCRSVAFPLISGGVYGYPKAEALAVGVRTVRAYLAAQEEEIEVYFVFLRKDDFQLTDSDFSEIDRYIGRNYEPEKIGLKARKNATAKHGRSSIHANALGMIFSTKDSDGVFSEKESAGEVFSDKESSDEIFTEACISFAPMLGEPFVLDESFSEMLLRLIDERGLTDPEVYKAANMSRKLFSKIRSDVHYQPSKKTVAALIIALKLRMEEAEELMMKAGFAFSNSVLFDVIIRYYIGKAQYDLFKINETLFEKDQPLLGQE